MAHRWQSAQKTDAGISLIAILADIADNAMLSAAYQKKSCRQASIDLDVRRGAGIEAIKVGLRAANPKYDQACVNAAGFQQPEYGHEYELARLRWIRTCVGQLAQQEH